MNRRSHLLAPLLFAAITNTAMAVDLSSPESALRSLEQAYTSKDIEAAVASKDFDFEARQLLLKLKNINTPDQELVAQTARVLEMSFRKHMRESGFPDFSKLRCEVIAKRPLRADLIELTEECTSSDGTKSRDTLHAAKSPAGWRIVILPP